MTGGCKKQFINGLNEETIIAKIIKEVTVLQEASKVSSKQVLMSAQRIEVKECRSQC